MPHSDLVKSWYSDPVNWIDPGEHAHDFDRHLLFQSIIEDKDVLNLGCHYPRIEMDFAQLAKSWTAIDFSPEVIEKCKLLVPDVNFLVMDMVQLQFDDESFDTVLDLSSGDHLDAFNYALALQNIYDVLKPDGFFVTTYANLDYADAEETFGEWGYARWARSEDLKKILEIRGFKIIVNAPSGQRSGFLCQK
jgi:SAM-dependent methyltransferase